MHLIGRIGADDRDRLQAEALEGVLHDEGADAIAVLAAGAREDDAPAGFAGAGNEDLGPVEHIAIPLALGASLNGAAGIGAAARLGDGDEGLLPRLHGGDGIFLDLRLAALEDDIRRIPPESMAGSDVG